MKYYESKITGNRYPKDRYINHGYGGMKNGYMDLPKDEYPYTIFDEDEAHSYDIEKYFNDVMAELALIERSRPEPTHADIEFNRRLNKACANWLTVPIPYHLNRLGLDGERMWDMVDPFELRKLAMLVEFTDILDFTTGKKVLEVMIDRKSDVWSVIESMNLLDRKETSEIESIVTEIMNQFPDKLIAFKNGNKNLLSFFMGETMKRLKTGNGREVMEIVNKMVNL